LNSTLTQVLERSSDDPDIGSTIASITTMRLLEGSWLLALSHGGYALQLLVLDTLLPQQDPRSWRILDLPPLLESNTRHRILTQCENSFAECPEFSVDPAQTIFVLFYHPEWALVVPAEPLMRHMHRVRTSPYMPWNEWGEDIIAVHLPVGTRTLQLHDTKLLALCSSVYLKDWGVLTYDLSKLGHRDIQVQQINEGADTGCKRILSTPRQLARGGVRDGSQHCMQLVGDQVLCFFVSPVYVQRRSYHFQGYTSQARRQISGIGYFLRIWKIGGI
jgi:hypothetical protein